MQYCGAERPRRRRVAFRQDFRAHSAESARFSLGPFCPLEQRACQQIAKSRGRRAEEIAAELIIRVAPPVRTESTPEEILEQEERLRAALGSEDLGYPTGEDNENIDTDLAREYGASRLWVSAAHGQGRPRHWSCGL